MHVVGWLCELPPPFTQRVIRWNCRHGGCELWGKKSVREHTKLLDFLALVYLSGSWCASALLRLFPLDLRPSRLPLPPLSYRSGDSCRPLSPDGLGSVATRRHADYSPASVHTHNFTHMQTPTEIKCSQTSNFASYVTHKKTWNEAKLYIRKTTNIDIRFAKVWCYPSLILFQTR